MKQQSLSLMRGLSQAIFSPRWTAVTWLLGALYVATWVPKLVRLTLRQSSAHHTPSAKEGVHLENLTAERDRGDTDIDIVAIHGLDTKSPDTWTWKSKGGQPDVNWLADSNMLPSQMERARIYTCDWPAILYQPSELAPKTVDEYTRPLLDGIRRELLRDDGLQEEPRPILFIASCLGGVILSAALVDAANTESDYHRVFRATRGIVFLATPFRGTSFADVANWAEVGLRFHAAFKDEKITTLIDNVKAPLSKIINDFTRIYKSKENPIELVSFYEGKTTSLPKKVFPWLPLRGWLRQEKLLVDENSANLDMVSNRLRLDRRHSLMNKFSGPDCTAYQTVAGKITAAVAKILRGTLLNQADRFILTNRYTKETLEITRLSGAPLSMEQCYINLAIVTRDVSQSTLGASLKIQTPEQEMQVSLPTLFSDRKGKQPRRIIIRGSAGVGKTTLCKKIVYDFHHGKSTALRRSWATLFDRILWVPLRKLKEKPVHSFNDLFCHEFFSLPQKREDLANHLADMFPKISSRTLFLLDGLDEILPDLDIEGNRFKFLEELLGQQNVIVTSRPSANLPYRLRHPDLELETIGFYPPQVNQYIENNFGSSLDEKKAADRVRSMMSFLETKQLLQSLVRIPIQLDALCYTWDEYSGMDLGSTPDTMTSTYIALEEKLWKKDAVKMSKIAAGVPVTLSHVASGATSFMSDERQFLELLAISGLHNNKIEFSSADWGRVSSHLRLQGFLPNKTLPHISFLRTASQNTGSGYCHFIHLTFQEYFAARYFVEKWNTPGDQLELLGLSSTKTHLVSPVQYLRKHKYTARYDIFWRFVAGILDREHQAQVSSFINAIEQEPLDLLGPTHQRLVMNCLSEISSGFQMRRGLERRLTQWLLFETRHTMFPHLSRQAELPDLSLNDAIQSASGEARSSILRSLSFRPSIPDCTLKVLSSWLHSGHPNLEDVLRAFGGPSPLPDDVLDTLVLHLDTESAEIRIRVADALSSQADLPQKLIYTIAKHLDNENSDKLTALKALCQRPSLPDEVILQIVKCLNHESTNIREHSLDALFSLDALPFAALAAIEARLDDPERELRITAFRALCSQPCLPHDIAQAIAVRFDHGDPTFLEYYGYFVTAPVLTVSLLSALLEQLDVDKWIMWSNTSILLSMQPALPAEVLSTIALRLNDRIPGVRVSAIEVLGRRPRLPDELLLNIAAMLHDRDEQVRSAAVGALGSRPDLSEEIRTDFMTKFNDEAFCVRLAAVEASRKQVSLSKETLSAIANHLGDDALALRREAIEALSEVAELPQELLSAVASHANDEDYRIRRAAMKALCRVSVLPSDSELFYHVLGGLHSHDEDARELAAEALTKCPKIPDDMFAELETMMNEENQTLKRYALEALCRQPALPKTVLSALSVKLNGLEEFESFNLVDVLKESTRDSLFPFILNSSHAAAICKPLILGSLWNPFSFYIEDNEFCFNFPEGVRRFPIGNRNPNILEHLKMARPVDIPAVSGVVAGEDDEE